MSQSVDTTGAPQSSSERKSGRAVFDQSGTVWEWQTATGVFERHVSEEQLARLEAVNLELVEHPAPNMGRAIYDSEPVGRAVRKQVFMGRPGPVARATSVTPIGVFRQFWRRLVLSV